MVFYPKHKTTVRYSLGDLLIKKNNRPYSGYYLKTSDGKYFAGSNHMKPGFELIIDLSKQNLSKHFGASQEVKSFNFKKKDIKRTLGGYSSLPINKPFPARQHYVQGFFPRFFAKRINGTNYSEIDEETYNDLKTQNGKYDHNLYKFGTIAWNIKGPKVFQNNAQSIKRLSTRFPNLIYAFPILNEYAEVTPILLENQHTNGGELYYGDGTEYIGPYHIHPTSGPMVGAVHTEEPHSKLYYFNQLPYFGSPYEDWLSNYQKIECFKCIAINNTLSMVSTQRSSLLGCLEGSYDSEQIALENCPRVQGDGTIEDSIRTTNLDRPNPPLEGGGGPDYPTWICGTVGGDETIYSNFDNTDSLGDETNIIVGGDSDGVHPPIGYGGGGGGDDDNPNIYDPPGGGGYGPSCFTPNTLITMADGTEKPISSIKIGEKVKSEIGESTVLDILIHEDKEYSVYSINNSKPFVTAEHPFKTIDGWKAIDAADTFEQHQVLSKTLDLNDVLVKLNENEVVYDIKLGPVKYPKVYNLSLNNEHVYYANGYLVHNLKTVAPDRMGNGGGGGGFDIDDYMDTWGFDF